MNLKTAEDDVYSFLCAFSPHTLLIVTGRVMKTMTLLLSFLSISTFASAVHYDPTLPTPLHSVPLHVRKAYRRRDDRNLLGSELTPLYPGYGTHISYIYVGTPPQRQSVIIDTGSSYTAFPCEGCQNCGQHTDNYFYPSNSSTSVVAKCGKSTCSISQSYSEGSSWQAYKITDKLWVGGLAPGLVKNANDYAIDFMFGCQTSETGLFRTQLADGIMGMSSSSNTLMPQLFEKKLVDNKIFALCFRIGGGIMTLGGVDQRIHSSDVSYAKLYPSSSNWFRVNILELSLVEMSGPGKSTQHNISGAASAMNAGSGTIVDSGTTDTYLPSKLKDSFEKAFLAVTGIRYTAGTAYTLTSAQVKSLPDIKITMRDEAGTGSFDLYFPVSAYADDENGKYAFRIYLTESSGAVLGANFMRGRNIIFDSDGGRVGFALSSCKYEDYEGIPFVPPEPPMVLPPLPVPIDLPKDKNNCTMEPAGYCTAVCNETSDKSYQVSGVQTFYDECTNQYEKRTCIEFCRNDNTLARGVSYDCIDSHWSECDHTCNQHREVAYISKENKCSHKKEERSCATDLCPQDTKDFFVFADLKFWYPAAVAPRHWEKIYEEDLFSALSILLKVSLGYLRGTHQVHSCINHLILQYLILLYLLLDRFPLEIWTCWLMWRRVKIPLTEDWPRDTVTAAAAISRRSDLSNCNCKS